MSSLLTSLRHGIQIWRQHDVEVFLWDRFIGLYWEVIYKGLPATNKYQEKRKEPIDSRKLKETLGEIWRNSNVLRVHESLNPNDFESYSILIHKFTFTDLIEKKIHQRIYRQDKVHDAEVKIGMRHIYIIKTIFIKNDTNSQKYVYTKLTDTQRASHLPLHIAALNVRNTR